MRVYSNILLSLPHIVHVLHTPYTGRCGNLYTFNVRSGHTSITVRPFIELLQENRKYYCYDTFYRNKYIEKFGNISRTISQKKEENMCIYIPQFSMADDIFVIKDDKPSQIPSVNLPAWLKYYSPPLL